MKKIEKPWGYELIWAHTDKYVGKLLHIVAGHRLSRQYHVKKEETLLVQSGEMSLELDVYSVRHTLVMRAGDTCHIKPGMVHRMVAITDVVVVEVSTPELDDVVRLEDNYGRTS